MPENGQCKLCVIALNGMEPNPSHNRTRIGLIEGVGSSWQEWVNQKTRQLVVHNNRDFNYPCKAIETLITASSVKS